MKTLDIDLDKIRIKPITSGQDFEEANEIIEALIDADGIEDASVRQRALEILNAVTILAVEYEKKNFPIPAPSPVEAIKERMAMLNLTQKEVAQYFGGENRISEVLTGKRKLSLKMIRALHKNLGIPAEVLIA